ncbi:hypothetical protein LOK49_LG01G00877 [Camellia lanceoleosa]|uniref:Uncharacterized protein n=1 Tax=Camellia lanceoleosa TaxID=1840588 RepID=A0ACC0IYU7_9ERIC|nr:hypothetical protein LOK49_LG01G00877 [Camellia lanceoleosa]
MMNQYQQGNSTLYQLTHVSRSYADAVQNGGLQEKKEVVVKAYESGNGWLHEMFVTTCVCQQQSQGSEEVASKSQDRFDQLSKHDNGDEDDETAKAGKEEMSRKDDGASKEQGMVVSDAEEKGRSNQWGTESAVKETGCDVEHPNDGGVCMEVGLQQVGSSRKKVANEIQKDTRQNCSTGFIRSVSGSENFRPNIFLDVVLNKAQLGGFADGPIIEASNLSECADQSQPSPLGNTSAQLGVNNRGTSLEGNSGGVGLDKNLALAQDIVPASASIQPTFTLRNTGSHRGELKQRKKLVRRPRGTVANLRKGSGGRREWKGGAAAMESWSRGAAFRAKVGSAARSVSTGRSSSKEMPGLSATLGLNGQLSNGDKEVLDEAVATIRIGKALGICFGGKDEEVIKKLKDMEVLDKERALPKDMQS